MSLINDALKKAQRERGGEPADAAPLVPGGREMVARRGQPSNAKMMVMITGGALVLVVLSVGLTVFLLNRPAAAPAVVATSAPPPAQTAPTTTPEPEPSAPAATAAPIIVPPATKSAVAEPQPIIAPEPASVAASPKQEALPPPPAFDPHAVAVADPAVAAPATVPASSLGETPAAPGELKQEERVYAFLDSARVAGIRASGADSRVLMNERVYRINDIVERSLGLRLTKVEPDRLTFSDAGGATYVKTLQ